MVSYLRAKTGFDRDLWLLQGEMFTRRMVMSSLEIVRPIYLALIGFSPIEIGIITTVGTIATAVESLVFGSLSDKHGRKPFFLMGAIFSVLRLVLYATSRDFIILVLAQGIGALGEGAGAGQPIVSGFIADKTDVHSRPRVFSILAISSALSGTIGSLMAVLPAYYQTSMGLNDADAHALLFWIGAAINAAAIVFVLPIREPKRQRMTAEDRTSPRSLSWREIGKFSLLRSTDGVGMSLVSSLLPLYFYLRFGIGSEDLAPIYALARFLAIPTYIFVPAFSRKVGNVTGLVISRIVTGAVIAVFAIAPSFQTAGALFITYRLLFEFAMPMRQAFSTEIVKAHQTGTMLGIGNSARAFTQSLAPTIAGYLFEFASLSIPFFSGAAILAFNGVQYHLFYGGTDRKPTSEAQKEGKTS